MPARKAVFLAALALIGLVAIGLYTPLPSPAEVREWADGGGAWTPLLVLVGYAVLAALPIPRTVFTLSAGLVLGEALGLAVAMVGTALAAAIGFGAARTIGRRWFTRHLDRDAVRAVNQRVERRGGTAVLSLRLLPILPFAPVTYCCGLSAVRLRPYLVGTVLGCLPGTAAAVLLGDALTGSTPPGLLAVYAGCAAAGAVGLYVVVRSQRAEEQVTERVEEPVG